MAIAAVEVRNGTCNPITLPAPYQGILAPGQSRILLTTKSAFQAACGGAASVQGLDVIDQTGASDSVLLNALAQPGAGVFQGVRGVSSSNVTLTAPGASIGGVSPSASASPDERRFLLVGQSTTSQNGVWVWNGASAAMTRAADMAEGTVVKAGALLSVRDGTGADSVWQVTNSADVLIGTDSLTAAELTGAGSGALTDANLSDATPEVGTLDGSAGTSGDVSRADHAHPGLAFRRVTTQVTFSDVSLSSPTNSVNLNPFPEDCLLACVVVEKITPFTGGTLTDVDVDILGGAALGPVALESGTGMETAPGTALWAALNAPSVLSADFTSTGGDLDELTAGECWFHAYYIPLVTAVP